MWLFVVMVLPCALSFVSKVMINTITIARKHNQRFPSSLFSSYIEAKSEETALNVLCLDFDGVLCASSEESSYSAVVSSMRFWPSTFQHIQEQDKAQIQKSIQYLRPVIETGYENMLMARYLFENKDVNLKVTEKQWTPAFRDQLIEIFNTNKNDLIKAFGNTRDSLINADLKAWIGMNKIYAPIKAILSSSLASKAVSDSDINENNHDDINLHLNPNCYIITTKQMRFVQEILNNQGIASLPSDRIFDLDNPYGSKIKVLEELTRRHSDSSKSVLSMHFIEDRMETLLAVASIPTLLHVKLYLVDWGYNTAEEKLKALQHSRIQLINYENFQDIIGLFKC